MAKVTMLSDGLTRPCVATGVNTVVVETDEGTPLVVIAETLPGAFSVIPATDPDFGRILKGLGLDNVTVNVRQLAMSKPKGELVGGPLLDNLIGVAR